MPLVPHLFKPLGVLTSRLCFGCGTLVGRSTFKQSAALVEAALDLGIRYFDTAPNYGFGTAEEVIGAVIGNMPDVIVASKVGYARPPYSELKNTIRRQLKPILDRSRPLKTFARSFYAAKKQARPGSAGKPRDLSNSTVHRSLETSLKLLRRDRIDVFLAHDADAGSLTAEARSVFERLKQEGSIGSFGVASSDPIDRDIDFGDIWQSAWPRNPSQPYSYNCTYMYHGVIRSAEKTRWGNTQIDPAVLLRDALALQPESFFIVATSTPRKLRELASRFS